MKQVSGPVEFEPFLHLHPYLSNAKAGTNKSSLIFSSFSTALRMLKSSSPVSTVF